MGMGVSIRTRMDMRITMSISESTRLGGLPHLVESADVFFDHREQVRLVLYVEHFLRQRCQVDRQGLLHQRDEPCNT